MLASGTSHWTTSTCNARAPLKGRPARVSGLACSLALLLLLCSPRLMVCQSNLEKYSVDGCNTNLDPKQCLKVGIVSSMTGELTDWNEILQGWQVYKFKIEQEDPNGIPILAKDGTYRYSFDLDWRDDESNLEKHQDQVADLLDSGVDFIANAQPNFAVEEAAQSNQRGILNFHGSTSNPALYEQDLPMVFGLSQPLDRFFPEIIKQFKDAGVQKIAIVYREDLAELRATCQAAIAETKRELIVVQDLPYTSSDPEVLMGVTEQISLSSKTEAVVGCTLAIETHRFIKNIDQLRKPLKGVLFTNGPHNLTFLEEVGELAENVLQPVPWTIDTPVTDFLMVNSVEFSLLTNFLVGTFPTHISAGAAACAYVLQVAVQNSFKPCNLAKTGGDAHAILFGDANGNPLISCDDNQNDGKQRVVNYLSEIAIDVFFGKVLFNELRQNFASEMKTLQVFRKTEDLQPFFGQSIVLPLNLAQKSIVMPQPNRYKVVCPPGSYQNPDEFEPCIPCAPGLFQIEPGALFCYRCFKNSYVSEGGAEQCNSCPINSETAVQGASDITECHCKEGTYTKERKDGTACEPCPEHATCAGGMDPPRPLPGWYAETDRPYFMYDCNPGSLCTGNYTCETGYQGRLCQDCADGYFVAFDNCLECISPGGNIVAMLCMYALFVYLVVGLSRKMETIHLLMNFCQTLSVIALFNMQWPLIMETIFNIAAILSFEMDIIQPQCVTDNWGFAENLYIQLSYPAFFFVFQGLWAGALYLAFRAKMKISGQSLEDFSSADFSDSLQRRSSAGSQKSFTSQKSFGSGNIDNLQVSGWWLFFQNFFHVPSSPQEMNEVLLEKMSVPFMAFNLGYVVILKYCLQTFSCLDFEGTSYMYFNPSQMCYTPEHFEMMIAAGAGLILYVAGTWFMFIYVLYTLKKTKSFSKKRPLLLFGWMYERYEAKYFWFELSVLLEKTVLVVIAVFIKTDPILQVVIMLIVTLAVMLLSIKTSAPVDSTTAVLLTATEGCQMVIMVLGLIFYNSQTKDRTYTVVTVIGSVALIGLLAALTIVFFVEVAFYIVLLVLRARHKNVASKWGQDTRLHTHMYRVFKPWFMFKWLSKAEPEDWLYWHRLCKLFHDSVHPTCETSYLSHEKVGHFWAYLINSFPEMLDFLASVEEVDRNEFVNVIDVMYEHYFDSSQTYKCQLNSVITDRFRAAIGQWLSSASDSEMVFVRKVITRAFAKAQGKEAEENMSRAFSRSSKSGRGRTSEAGLAAQKLLSKDVDDDVDSPRPSLPGALTSNDGSAALNKKIFALTSGDRTSSGGSPRSKKSARVCPEVNFVDSSGHAASPLGRRPPKSPFAIAQGQVEPAKEEPSKENGNNTSLSSFDAMDHGTPAPPLLGNPRNGWSVPVGEQYMPTPRDKPMSAGSRSDGRTAKSPYVPQQVSIDTEELLRIQNNPSPCTSSQPQPQVQPPRLAGPAPANASDPPTPQEASIDQTQQLWVSPRASPGDPEKVFQKRPVPRSQTEAPGAHAQPADIEPSLPVRPKTSDTIVRSFYDLD